MTCKYNSSKYNAQIDHHNVIKECVTLDPRVVIAGNVTIGRYTQVHTGAIIINRKRIGENSILGAGTVIINDIPDSFDLILISVSSRNSLIESIVICCFEFFSWCITNPNPALESVKAGQKIGTLLSYAVSINEPFFFALDFK